LVGKLALIHKINENELTQTRYLSIIALNFSLVVQTNIHKNNTKSRTSKRNHQSKVVVKL